MTPTETPSPLIALAGVDFAHDGKTVLSGVDLAVADGEIVTLIGPNGAGKSTLVRIALGLLKPDRGRVVHRPGLRVGYLPQRLAIDPALPLTARRLLDLPRRHDLAILRASLDEVGVGDLLERPVQDLSGGEFQRLMLARALLREPDVLVLDEPLQGVDFAGQIALFQLIRRTRDRRGCGILMVSHDLHLVMAGTDRVVCLNHHVCCSGEPEAVGRHPEYLALFGPMAARGLAFYTHEHDHRHDLSGAVVAGDPARREGGG